MALFLSYKSIKYMLFISPLYYKYSFTWDFINIYLDNEKSIFSK